MVYLCLLRSGHRRSLTHSGFRACGGHVGLQGTFKATRLFSCALESDLIAKMLLMSLEVDVRVSPVEKTIDVHKRDTVVV